MEGVLTQEKWEEIKQHALEIWQGITWEQAQEIVMNAYKVVLPIAESNIEHAATSFIDNINWRILEKNAAYSAPLENLFRDAYSLEPKSPEPELHNDPDIEPEM